MNNDRARHKPKLVFFQFEYDERLPPFLLTHRQEHVICLSHFFDVVVIRHDCDYGEICDTHKPDLALFESGVNHPTCRRLRISGTRSNAHVPKLGLHHADAFCNARAGFISDMESWGIETAFAIATTAGEHSPEMADRLFYWPVFIDPAVFRDYGLWKSIPVLLTGNTSRPYPWRNAVFPILSAQFPSLTCPHPGYEPGLGFSNVLSGERYARTLNASWFVPTCGTVAKESIRKHFEVPAARACLVTERSPVLEAAGFADMQNCVFADGGNISEKLESLLVDPVRLDAIIDAGHRLVHERHTYLSRNQIHEWYRLHTSLRSDERIVQTNPFSAPVLADPNCDLRTRHLASRGLHLQCLEEGDAQLRRGDLLAAEVSYLRCVNYMGWMPEPKLRLAHCSLHLGEPRKALQWVRQLLDFTLHTYGATEPDPVEWAYHILAQLCCGEPAAASASASSYPELRHPELERALWLCHVLSGARPAPPADTIHAAARPSIHVLPRRSFPQWRREASKMLRACGQGRAASLAESDGPTDGSGKPEEWPQPRTARPGVLSLVPRAATRATRQVSAWLRGPATSLRRRLRSPLHALEHRLGYFLPLKWSSIRTNPLYSCLFEAARSGRGALVIVGADPRTGLTRMVLAGAQSNSARPAVVCISSGVQPWARGARHRSILHGSASLISASGQDLPTLLDGALRVSGSGSVTMVIIDFRMLLDQLGREGLTAAQLGDSGLILLVGTNSVPGHLTATDLRRNPGYEVLAEDPAHADGYVIFSAIERGRAKLAVGDAMPEERPSKRTPPRAVHV
jgi:hypothetical protein